MQKVLHCEKEFVSGGIPETDAPWFVQTYEEKGAIYVKSFSKTKGEYEWNCTNEK